jgi:glyoxylase-like metal-dependent hydrolase (beta-lactamase superfamily II)
MAGAALIATLLSGRLVSAQTAGAAAPDWPIAARDADARMHRLAPDVYAIIHDDATTAWPSGVTEWPHGNTGVIVGDDAVLVVDAAYLPSRARADIALIRKVTAKPVRYLVNTHWHGDHTHGNGVYQDSFPGLVILGQTANRDWIATNLDRYPAIVGKGPGGGSDKQATIDRYASWLAARRDSAGRPLDAAQRASLTDNLRRRRLEISDFRTIRNVPPTVLFESKMVIYLGERRVEMENRGRANSPADVTVHLPAERIMFVGDIVVYPVPYVGASHPLPWIDVLQAIERTPITTLVPGHGPPLADMSYVRLVRELFEATRDRVRSAMRQGVLQADIVKQTDLADLRARFMRLPHPLVAGEWEGTPEVLVERMHQCVQGYRC